MTGPLLLLLTVGVSGVYCGHSLQYYYTAVSVPGYGLPVFSIVGYVNGRQIDHYSSDTGRAVPVAPWMNNEGKDYWERQKLIAKGAEAVFKHNVKTLMQRFNQTGGYHSVQRMYGCELRDDGSIGGYDQHGYDGKDLLALDTERGVYYPLTDQAQITTQRINSPEEREGERTKNYLENLCIESLREYIQYGKEELDRRVRPEVKVFSQQSDGVTELHCQVYGFYPRDVDVNWKKNGIEIPTDEAKQVLPNTDGTYQIRATVEVQPVEGESYACHVDHSSLKEPLIVIWGPKPDSGNIGVIIGIVVGALIVLVLVVGIILWRKKSSGNKPDYALAANKEGSPASSTA
ncbi:class I histocompatibility antigen, F10 alpha chain-like [Pelobates fuscus]|uniref:class I histocompatibility antigen, F10 alpha chain-like n=1 Tax=Pelobates fuscus TaxID=191477 RepID=UPI002FE4D23B